MNRMNLSHTTTSNTVLVQQDYSTTLLARATTYCSTLYSYVVEHDRSTNIRTIDSGFKDLAWIQYFMITVRNNTTYTVVYLYT
jgi:hypothetical protein